MNETKKPEPGEWWRTDNGEILFFVGCTSGGDQSWEDRQGCFIGLVDIDRGWQHLPDCNGFEWVEPEPEKWPKYYNFKTGFIEPLAYIKRTSQTNCHDVRRDGSCSRGVEWSKGFDKFVHDGYWIEITESEALARLTPRCPDCCEPAGDGHADVCPEAWVEHVGNVPRPSIDQWRWWSKDAVDREWNETMSFAMVHGGYEATENTLQVRCRRKDLPMAAVTEHPKRREMTEAERQCADVPQGFVEITDGEWRYRESVDWVWYDYRKVWQPVNRLHGMSKNIWLPGYPRACCHVSDAPQAAVTASDGEDEDLTLKPMASTLEDAVGDLKRRVEVLEHAAGVEKRDDRSMPVTVEWLKSMGFSENDDHLKISVAEDTILVFYPHHQNKWSVVDTEDLHCVDLAESIPNRGRVIDLLKGLGVMK